MPKKADEQQTETYENLMQNLSENNESLKSAVQNIETISPIDEKYKKSITRIIETIRDLQDELKTLIETLRQKTSKSNLPIRSQTVPPPPEDGHYPTMLKCSNWEDFQKFAFQAPLTAFTYREADRLFEANAWKNNQIIVYIGTVPKLDTLLRAYLSTELSVEQNQVFEGAITEKK